MVENGYVKKAVEDNYLEINQDKKTVSYQTREGSKVYPLNKSEESVRTTFYTELIYKYKYEPKKIGIEVEVPRRTPADRADIVIYEDDEGKKPYIVAECKRDGISEPEIKQAIEQTFGNANSLRGRYAILVAGSVRVAFDVAGYPPNERERNIISDIPIRYGTIPKFTYKKGAAELSFATGERDLRKPNRQELLNKFQQCHDIIWEGGRRNPAEAFDEMSKIMFCKIWDERWITKNEEYYCFQIGTHETKKEVAGRVREIYRKAQELEPGVFIDPIKAADSIVYSVVQILQEISLAKADLDVKGEAFEHFLGRIFKGEMGQYFTSREIVRFMVSLLEPNQFDYVIDPACGSGGFLLQVLEQMRERLKNELGPEDARDRWRDFALSQVWGIEINSQLARVAMMNMILHEDGHTNIENGDALDNPETWVKEEIRNDFGKKFSLLLTNPPFGSNIKWEEKNYLKRYKLGREKKRQKAEVLFVERSLELIKPGGRLGIVLPDGILANYSLQPVRDFVTREAQILGIVSLPEGAFTYYGSGVKASLVFLRKKKEGEKLMDNYPIFMARAEHIGYDATGRSDKTEFPEILKSWKRFKEHYLTEAFAPKELTEVHEGFFHKAPLVFVVERGNLADRIDVGYSSPEYRQLYEKFKNSPFQIQELGKISESIFSGTTPLSGGPDYTTRSEGIPFVRSGNVNETDEIDFDSLLYIRKNVHEKKMKSSQLKKNDILVAIVGATIGQVATYRYEIEANINQAIAAVRLKKNIDPDYVKWFLRSDLGQEEFHRLKRPVARANLNLAEVASIKVPIPPRSIQHNIVSIMNEALAQKRKMEKDADRLIESIDSYISNKLGITLPEATKQYPLEYSVRAKLLERDRWDVEYWGPQYQDFENAINKGKFNPTTLGSLFVKIINGLDYRVFAEKGTPYLRVGDIKPFEIDYDHAQLVSLRPNEIQKDIRLESGNVLLTRKGTFGVAALVEEEVACIISSEIFKITLMKKETINPLFIVTILNSSIGKVQSLRQSVGTIMGSLSQDAVKCILMPQPPRPTQDEIAGEVKERIRKAKRLREEAQTLLKKAKSELESILLGEQNGLRKTYT